jgi:hypothetical protein
MFTFCAMVLFSLSWKHSRFWKRHEFKNANISMPESGPGAEIAEFDGELPARIHPMRVNGGPCRPGPLPAGAPDRAHSTVRNCARHSPEGPA